MSAIREDYICYPSNIIEGYKNRPSSETNDCTVVAWAALSGKTYLEAREQLEKEAGRVPRKGLRGYVWEDFLFKEGLRPLPSEDVKIFYPSTGKLRRMTLGSFLKKYPTGRYVVNVRRHTCTVIDGRVVDNNPPLRTPLEGAWG